MKKYRYLSSIAVLLVVGLLAIGIVGTARSAPPFSLTPMNDHFQLEPGGSYQGSFAVTNEGEEARVMQVGLTDFTLTEGGSFKRLTGGKSTEHGLAQYVSFSPASKELAAGETVEVQYSVDLPGQVKEIPRWAAIMVTSKDAAQTTEEGSESISFQINLNFSYVFALFQRASSSTQPSGRVGSVNAKLNDQALTLEVPFYNQAESIAETDGYVEVRNAAGKTELRYEFSADQLVLPDKKRIFSHTFQNPELEPGNYLVIAALDYGADSMLAGQAMLQVE